jgi:hypothetical protein
MNRVLLALGILGGFTWIALAAISFSYGVPGNMLIDGFEWGGKLGTVALVGMGMGFFGFFRSVGPLGTGRARNASVILLIGFAVMVLSSISDFWFSLEFPVIKGYPMLQTWENVFAFGMLFVYLSTATFGWNYYRSGIPGWLGVVFLVFSIAAGGLAFIDFGLSFRAVGVLCVVACGEMLLSSR